MNTRKLNYNSKGTRKHPQVWGSTQNKQLGVWFDWPTFTRSCWVNPGSNNMINVLYLKYFGNPSLGALIFVEGLFIVGGTSSEHGTKHARGCLAGWKQIKASYWNKILHVFYKVVVLYHELYKGFPLNQMCFFKKIHHTIKPTDNQIDTTSKENAYFISNCCNRCTKNNLRRNTNSPPPRRLTPPLS